MKDLDTQFLCKDCARYNLCKYYDRRKRDSYICKYFHLTATFGMTNGEVIQALFPKAKVFKEESNIEYPYVDVFLYSENDMNCYKKEWWNAPYKADREVSE